MQKQKPDQPDRLFKIAAACTAAVLLLAAAWWFWPRMETGSPVMEKKILEPSQTPQSPLQDNGKPETVQPDQAPADPSSVIPYQPDGQTLQETMDRRKAEQGLDKSVDMVVKPDESLNIGDTTVSMQEILEKIRISEGGMIEGELDPEADQRKKQERTDRLFTRLEQSGLRLKELEKILEAGAEGDFRGNLKEYAELKGIIQDYETYKKIREEIAGHKTLLENADLRGKLRDKADELRQKKSEIERRLTDLITQRGGLKPGEDLTATVDRMEARFFEIEKTLENPDNIADAQTVQSLIRERKGLEEIAAAGREYRDLLDKIQKIDALLAADDIRMRETLEKQGMALRLLKKDLEDTLAARLLPDEKVTVYGIHIVRPEDNIWNIHFQFLKEYFRHRGIVLSSTSDEPVGSQSSGVGRILKFSETMVFIYNIKEGRLSDNLNLIHPLSKIVVFNMGQAFDLLRQIDYTAIRHVRFDGETLWIPAGSQRDGQ